MRPAIKQRPKVMKMESDPYAAIIGQITGDVSKGGKELVRQGKVAGARIKSSVQKIKDFVK